LDGYGAEKNDSVVVIVSAPLNTGTTTTTTALEDPVVSWVVQAILAGIISTVTGIILQKIIKNVKKKKINAPVPDKDPKNDS
jgi:phosphate/sulfate permease